MNLSGEKRPGEAGEVRAWGEWVELGTELLPILGFRMRFLSDQRRLWFQQQNGQSGRKACWREKVMREKVASVEIEVLP